MVLIAKGIKNKNEMIKKMSRKIINCQSTVGSYLFINFAKFVPSRLLLMDNLV